MKLNLGVLSGLSVLSSSMLLAADKPNVLFILVDDLGYHQLNCYGNKSFFETPNIDKFASEGMKFTNAYAAAALSSPTRAAIISGKYPTRLQLTDWLNGYAPPANATLTVPNWTKGMVASENRLPVLMKENGYHTSMIGKWHISSNLNGFDEVFRFDGPKTSDACNGVDCHRVKQYTDSTISFIKRNKDKPFFCYLGHNSIHTPELENSALVSKYTQKAGSISGGQLNPIQGAMLETLDNYTGVLLDSLDRMGLSENTIVVITSDNGQFAPNQEVGVSSLRGSKCTFWEGGFREPLLVRWKGKIVAGSLCEKPVISMDFLPTLAELCGFTVPDLANLDGKSFAKNLTENPNLPIERPYMCWHYPHFHHEAEFLGAIHKGDWKLIENFNQSLYYKTGAFELYNLKDDPKETTNLIQSNPQKAAELYNDLQNWRTETKAQMPGTKNPVYGVTHFQLHIPNTSVKVVNFETQIGLTQGLQYDGSGTSLNLNTGNELTYYLNVTQAGNYKLKFLYNNNATTILIRSTSFTDRTIQFTTSTTWQSVASGDINLGIGIHKISILVTGAALNLDKICLTNENTTLMHDGDAPLVGKLIIIGFEPNEITNFYTMEGSSVNQNPTPTIVDNPDKVGVNQTNKCLYTRTKKNLTLTPKVPAWSTNFITFTFTEPIALTDDNRYFHLLHRKGQTLNTWMVYASEDGTNFISVNSGSCPSANTWFDIVSDIKSKLSNVIKIRIYLDSNWSGTDIVRYFEPTDFYYDELALTNSSTPRVMVISGVKHSSVENSIKIVPNPVSDRINIICESLIRKIEIYNFSGMKVSDKNIENSTEAEMDVTSLSTGIYLVKVTDSNNNMLTDKISKK